MKKIMFNDKYGLTAAVLQGRKTMTRRVVGTRMTEDDIKAYLKGYTELANKCAQYKIGEVVAVAQSYNDVLEHFSDEQWRLDYMRRVEDAYEKLWDDVRGINNKMFVKSELMLYQIQITDIKIERLQDISDDDCLKEGIIRRDDMINSQMEDVVMYTFENSFVGGVYKTYATPREAFATLIDKPGVGGPGTWERNPWVFAYSFKKIK